ncbi:zinc finger protein with KRAB and SCAN domains 2-like isoform X2 [Tachysurus vachellii]|uniref:zinc finger protein with KRAB and SCAN domains 2-like isoform X2 n=1 Tax=Tachysurus vachellii TaxID=175792 RepID=UPI00296AF36E|nr:zinc finger protein with KRAB and SCAN domains 2-like isoform X2 [Tachysurus vachellii]
MEKTEPWQNKETKTLIGIWSEDGVQRELEGTVRNQKVFQKISQRMWELGYNRSPDRCRVKIKKLKQDYRRLKEYNKRNGMNPKTNQWYEALDAVLGHRSVTETSTSSLLESVMKCNSVEDRADTDDEDGLSDDRNRPRISSPELPVTLPLSPGLSSLGSSNITAEEPRVNLPRIRGKRKRGHSNHIDSMREIFLMSEDREDRRQRVQQEFEERRLQVLQELEHSAGIREAELINTLAQFNQGLLSVMGQLVSVMANNHSPQPPP